MAYRTYARRKNDLFHHRHHVTYCITHLAEIWDGVYVGIIVLSCEPGELPPGKAVAHALYCCTRLAHGTCVIFCCACLWLLLGNVEYVFVAQMGVYISISESI